MIISGINLVMTVIGFAVSTMFMVFVCTRLICARMQLNASRRSFPTASRSDISLLERGLRGLEPVHVATFPTKKFSDEFFSSEEDSQCTVCLAEYQEKDILRILPYCGHSFHVTCIDIWLQQHSTCPICRISLRESPDRKRIMQPMFSSAIRSPHGLHSPSGYSSTVESQRMGPVQESHDASQVDTANTDESVSSFMEGIRVPKEISHEAENKCIESPSNT